MRVETSNDNLSGEFYRDYLRSVERSRPPVSMNTKYEEEVT